ncbi:MAG: DNA mismatch repair protein MutS [Sphingomonas sp.]|nr:DNA mismatch repair protein MutS [Sphingomonas sp.]
MARRDLSPEEAAIWARVKATVRPLRRDSPPRPQPVAPPVDVRAAPTPPPKKRAGRVPPVQHKAEPRAMVRAMSNTLDAGWDRRIGKGQIIPDSSIDLHGHSLASAHATLERGLAGAVARGDRVLLIVTGKPPRPGVERPFARGAIRAAVHDWLAISPHSGHIAAVRGAHPRHGGQGAIYIVLRRNRTV